MENVIGIISKMRDENRCGRSYDELSDNERGFEYALESLQRRLLG
jgi:hypothetical protein